MITLINVIGGLIVGIVQHDLAAGQAAETYTLLAIGDGLVAQIPSLIISIAAGMVVSRVANDQDIGGQMVGQLFAKPEVLYITGIIIGGLGSIVGSIFGAAFFVLLPLLLNYVPHWLGLPLSTATATYLEHMIFGALIVFFLIVEPHGLARLWATARQKLRVWPFPH